MYNWLEKSSRGGYSEERFKRAKGHQEKQKPGEDNAMKVQKGETDEQGKREQTTKKFRVKGWGCFGRKCRGF